MNKIVSIVLVIICFSCKNKHHENQKYNEEKTNKIEVKSLNKELDSLYKIGVFNGFSATIVDTTGILYNQGFGYADKQSKKEYTKNTIINIASISKVFIGIALLKAEELNLINLDDPINNHLPFKVINPYFPNDLITIRQLATHTSSIVDSDVYMETCYINKDDIAISDKLKRYELYYQNPSKEWLPLDAYLAKLLVKDSVFYNMSTFSNRKPGTLREYSNIGAALCALVVESASKKPFNEFTQNHIFKPLEMSTTNWVFEEANVAYYSKLYYDDQVLPYYKILSYPDGGLITSSTDLGKFLVELIKGHSGNGNILKPSSYKEFFKSQLEERVLGGKENFNVGLFIDKELSHNVIGHSGGDPGTNTLMYFNSEEKTGRIFITNTDSKKENSGDVMWGIWNALDQN